MKDIGDRLKKIRGVLNISQTDLGENLGISKQGVSNIENNRNDLNSDMIKKLYKTYNINPNFLIVGEYPMFMSELQEKEAIIKELQGKLSEDQYKKFAAFIKNTTNVKMMDLFIEAFSGDREALEIIISVLSKRL